jgi:DNA-binding MarR family transcriptional regulator
MSTAVISREARIRKIHDVFVSLMWIHKREFSQQLQTFGLTHPQFITLAALVSHKKPCAMRDLTEATFQDPPTMTGIIDRLVKMKLVRRTRSETDRRVVLVQANELGNEIFKQIEDQALFDKSGGYAALTDEELAALEELSMYLLRMYVGRYKSLQDADLDAELEKLHLFKSDPIRYAKLQPET